MKPYDIEQRVMTYVEDSSQYPLIRRMIDEAIQDICHANEPGKDWEFLYNDSLQLSSSSGRKELPSDVRSVSEIVTSSQGLTAKLEGRTVIFSPAPEPGQSVTATLKCYVEHGSVCDGNYNTAWTSSSPAENKIKLPKEAFEIIVYKVLMLMNLHENEVASTYQFYEKMYQEGLQFLRANYQIQIDTRVPVNATGAEALTVEWLVNFGRQIVGGRRDTYQLVRIVSQVASEMADFLNLKNSQRPANKNNMSDSLPTFGGKSIPAAYWMSGMKFACLKHLKQVTELDYQDYNQAMNALKVLYYSLDSDDTSFDTTTYGGMMDYLRGIWRNQRDDRVLWAVLNQTIADVMRSINTGETIKSVETTVQTDSQEFDLPNDFKQCVIVKIGNAEVVSIAWTSRGKPGSEQTIWQFPGNPRGMVRGLSFSIRGKKIVFNHELKLGTKFTMWYYPKHVTPTMNASTTLSMPLPIDSDLICKALEARVALESGDGNKYSALMQEFKEQVAMHNEAQNRSLSQDDRVVGVAPPVDYMLFANEGAFTDFDTTGIY